MKMAGVHDPEHLARRIDQMFIGNMKLHVNVPRFGKEEPRNKKRNEVPYVRVQKGFQGSVRPTIKPEVKAEKLDHWEAHLVTNLRKGATYKQALTNDQETPKERQEEEKGGSMRGEWKPEEINLEGIIEPWMERSIVGRLKSPNMIQSALDCIVMAGLHSVRVRYMGGLSVLLSGDEGVELMDAIKDSGEGWKEVFDDLSPWTPSSTADCRIPWIRCEGLPLQFWNEKNFEQVVKPAGSLIEVDAETSSLSCIRFARIRVKTSSLEPIFITMHIKIGDQVVGLRLMEEIGVWDAMKIRNCDQCIDSEEDLSDWSVSSQEFRSESEGEDGGGVEKAGGGEVVGESLGQPLEIFLFPLGKSEDSFNVVGPPIKAHDEGTKTKNNGGILNSKDQIDDGGGTTHLEACLNNIELDISYVSNSVDGGPPSMAHGNYDKIVGMETKTKNEKDLDNSSKVQSLNIGEVGVELSFVQPLCHQKERTSIGKGEDLLSGDEESTTMVNSKGMAVVKRKLPNQILKAHSEEADGHTMSMGSFLSCPIVRKQVRQNSYSMCSSLSDSDILNCNRGFWIRNKEDEARNIWDFGKMLGVSFSGEDREMISKIMNMEQRDEAEMAALDKEKAGGVQQSL